MDESSYKKFLEGAKTFILKFVDVLAIAHKWYEKNADNIVEYIKTFENFARIWRRKICKLDCCKHFEASKRKNH